MNRELKRPEVVKVNEGYWRVIIGNPPYWNIKR